VTPDIGASPPAPPLATHHEQIRNRLDGEQKASASVLKSLSEEDLKKISQSNRAMFNL